VARFYANENFPLPAVEELRRLGNDVLTIQETGRGGQALPDREVLDLARVENRILLTVNRRHFIRLHGSTTRPRWYRCLHLRSGLQWTGAQDSRSRRRGEGTRWTTDPCQPTCKIARA